MTTPKSHQRSASSSNCSSSSSSINSFQGTVSPSPSSSSLSLSADQSSSKEDARTDAKENEQSSIHSEKDIIGAEKEEIISSEKDVIKIEAEDVSLFFPQNSSNDNDAERAKEDFGQDEEYTGCGKTTDIMNQGSVREDGGSIQGASDLESRNEDGVCLPTASAILSSSSSASTIILSASSSSSASTVSVSKSNSQMNKRPRWDAPPPISNISSCAQNQLASAYINNITDISDPDIMICGNCKTVFTSLNVFIDHKNANKCRLRFVCHCQQRP